mgnify:CR=1 FL=1
MGNNFFTSSDSIFKIAENLSNQNFEELLPTNNYSKCDHIQINGTAKKFWFTTQAEIKNTVDLINANKGTLQNINLKEIKKWQTN